MADKEPQNQEPPENEPTEEDKYWDSFEKRLDSWFDKKVESYRKGNPDQSRTGGRTSMPKLVADVFIGRR